MTTEPRTVDERTPLIGNSESNAIENGIVNGTPSPKSATAPAAAAKAAARTVFGSANRILLAGFLMAFTLGITQVPYVLTSSFPKKLRSNRLLPCVNRVV